MNLSILDQNVLHAIQGLNNPAEAETVYLRLRDKLSPLDAEAKALQWSRACEVIVPGVSEAQSLHDGRDHGVMDFIRGRFLNMGASA